MADKKIQIKHRNGETWDLLFPVTKGEHVTLSDGSTVETSFTGLETDLSDKVDKATGKGLSSNDYTNAEKTKLSGLSDHSTDITDLQSDITDLESNKSDKTSVYTRSEIDTKLSNVKRLAIPVQSTEPTDSDLWYETL